MSQRNVDAFLRGNEAMNAGDVDAALEGAAEDVVVVALRSEVEGEYRGHEGVRKLIADNAENFEIWRIEYQDVRDLGDNRLLAIGTLHIRGRGGGVETDVPTAGIASFDDDGKMTRWEDFGDRRRALEAAGLVE